MANIKSYRHAAVLLVAWGCQMQSQGVVGQKILNTGTSSADAVEQNDNYKLGIKCQDSDRVPPTLVVSFVKSDVSLMTGKVNFDKKQFLFSNSNHSQTSFQGTLSEVWSFTLDDVSKSVLRITFKGGVHPDAGPVLLEIPQEQPKTLTCPQLFNWL